jgi:hypothetical protein
MDMWGLAYLSAELAIGGGICRLMIQAEQTLWQARNGMMICLFLVAFFSSVLSRCELVELLSINESFYGSSVDSCFPNDFNSRLGSVRKAVGMLNGLLFGEAFVCIYLMIKGKKKGSE